jgi:hypothetical protein
MAQLVGTFNGRRLYSDKAVAVTVNMKVNFADGSWIDMQSGIKYANGIDDIRVDPPFSAADTANTERMTLGPQTFTNATEISIRDVSTAAILVETCEGKDISVTLEGDQTEVNSLTVKREGDTVYVYGPENQISGNGITMRSGNSITHIGGQISGSHVSIGGISIMGGNIFGNGNVVINGNGFSATKPQVTVTVKVPKGTKVSLSGRWMIAQVGDTEGELNISAIMGGVKAGRVKNSRISIKGPADVTLAEVIGNLDVRIMGSGDFDAKSGKIDNLDISIIGSGDADINAEATSADLSVTGSGDIVVDKVINRPSRDIRGSGSIRVRNW